MKNILVIGGAGYIGSHCVRQLDASDHSVVVLDNLSYGHRSAVPNDVPFYDGDLGDPSFVAEVLSKHSIDVVMHFAAFAYVGESVTDPIKYYRNNVANTIHLLDTMIRCDVRQFIFSSTCATYGEPETQPILEDFPQAPINPYGQTKLDIENCLKALAKAGEISSVVFRYFNAAGAAAGGEIGEHHDPETHLIPLAIDAATGRRDALKVFGADYPTPDGTCLRDYIHVDDLSSAHIMAAEELGVESDYKHYNLGTGCPTSVLEILAAVEKVSGLQVPCENAPRRAGDPAILYADNRKARKELGWEPAHKDICEIIESAWQWHQRCPDGYSD